MNTSLPLHRRQQTEKQVLLDFYNSTNGPFWHNKDGWAGLGDYCRWYGVQCNDEGSVIDL